MKCKYCETEHPEGQIANPHYCIARLMERNEYCENKISELAESDFFYRKCVAGKESAREKRIKVLEAEIDRLKDAIGHPKRTYCAWCGFTVEIDDDAGSRIAEHIDTFEKHPLNIKIDQLKAEREEWKDKYLKAGDVAAEWRDKLAIMTAANAKLREALEIILPMAKGYAAEHPVGRNQEIVNGAAALQEQPCDHDKVCGEEGENGR